MRPTRLHLLLTSRCVLQCIHCHSWGGPSRKEAMTLAQVEQVLAGANAAGTIRTVVFDGGEPFLYFPVLVEGVRMARVRGFFVEVATNGDWATEIGAACSWLAPLLDAGLGLLSVSEDSFHRQRRSEGRARVAIEAASRVGIEAKTVSVDGGSLRYRGRAAVRLAPALPRRPCGQFDRCPDLDLSSPDRVDVDPEGHVSVCQGLAAGSLWWQTLAEILAGYRPDSDPILGPLVRGGPAALAATHGVDGDGGAVDACHLCYRTRSVLRERFPERLAPAASYGDDSAPA